MTYPTLEEIKQIAIESDIMDINGYSLVHCLPVLQVFAKHFYEEGRKMQRESDAKLCESAWEMASPKSLAEAIRNNTGE